MKKPIYLTLAVLFALAVFGCKMPDNKPEKKEDPKTLDPRLIGGRWYFPKNYSNTTPGSLTPKLSEGYYQFTSDSEFIYSEETAYYYNCGGDLSGAPVYSKNGIVYLKETDDKFIQYEFQNKFPFPNTIYYLTGDQRGTLNDVAAHGDLITFRFFCYDDYLNATPQWYFLVRFNEDGTAYQDY